MANRRESSGTQRSTIITRSISKLQKRKHRLLPLRDASLSSSLSGTGRKTIRDMLSKRHQKVLDYINRDTPDERDFNIDYGNLKVIHFPRLRHTADTRAEALTQLGVVWSTGSPSTRSKETEESAWRKKLASVMKMVTKNIKLPQRDLISLMSVCRAVHNTLICRLSLWLSLDFHRMNKAGDRLVAALSLKRYYNLEHINLACAEDIADKHLKLLITEKEVVGSLRYLESLNLDGCQTISNRGVKDVTSACPRLKKFSICENLRVTDFCIKSLLKNCKCLTDLNLRDCKNLTDNSLVTIGNTYHLLESLDISMYGTYIFSELVWNT